MESTTGTTRGRSVGRGWQWLGALVVVVVVAAFAFAVRIELPYYSIAPGSAVDAVRFVDVTEGPEHQPEGHILLTTVALGKVTLFEAIEGWLDPGVDVVKEELIIGDRDIDEDQLREENLQAMDHSKQLAIGVALEALGIDAITGSGTEIVGVFEGTPAEGALAVGDVIVGIDDAPVALEPDLRRVLADRQPGDRITLHVLAADGAPRDVPITLVAAPDDPDRAIIGISLTTKALEFDIPYEIELQSEQIGGPSAGLAFTLALIDVLTEGELTGGETVATTGTIELDGSVGEVGGVPQKTLAVRESGATLFIVPSGELELARRFAGDELRVEPADTLEEALAVLATVGGNGLALPDLGAEGAS